MLNPAKYYDKILNMNYKKTISGSCFNKNSPEKLNKAIEITITNMLQLKKNRQKASEKDANINSKKNTIL